VVISTTLIVPTMSAMHEQVQQRTSEQQQVGQNAKQVRPVFSEKEERGDGEEDDEHQASSRAKPTAIFSLMFVVHKASYTFEHIRLKRMQSDSRDTGTRFRV
jgi:hypothetical protein